MTHPGGRPRSQCPEKNELIELGKDLVEWASEPNQNKRLRFCDWYLPKGFIRKQWEHMTEKPEFQWYYQQARAFLGIKYMDNTVNPSIAHRFLRIYIPEVKEEEDSTKAYESELRSKEKITDINNDMAAAISSLAAAMQATKNPVKDDG